MRLNKFLATAGVASRRKSDILIEEGKVRVNSCVVTSLGTEIDEKKDKIEFEGNEIKLPEQFVYLKINKPKGYICSSNDEKGRKIVFDLIKDNYPRLFSVGRLDYDTEGLLILTNDGAFADGIMHPRNGKEKTYVCTVEGTILESELAVMRAGVVLEDGTRMPSCRITRKGFKDNNSRLEIVIDEGQNRQIRKMFEQINRSIVMLKRVAIGRVKLGGLSRGEYKPLSEEEKRWLAR